MIETGTLIRHPSMWPLISWVEIENAAHVEEQRWVVIEPDGTMAARIKAQGKFTSFMDVSRHPMDTQRLAIRLRAAERAQVFFFRPNETYPSNVLCAEDGKERFHLKDEYDISPIVSFTFGNTPRVQSGTGYQYSTVEIDIHVARRPFATVISSFLPMLVVSAMSLGKYFLSLKSEF